MDKILSDEEAQRIIYLKKKFFTEIIHLKAGFDESFELKSLEDLNTRYILSVRQSENKLSKITIHKREKYSNIPLVRLDINGKHTNPDGKIIIGSHIHIYKEGYNDAWAYPVPNENFQFKNINDFRTTFLDFLEIFNISKVKLIYESIYNNY